MSELFRAVREVPTGWQENLEEVFPRDTRLPWLKIHWHAGIEYAPTQRWVVYAMQPRLDLVPPDLLECCTKEDPRTWGVWVTPRVPLPTGGFSTGKARWVSDSFLSHEQWVLYQETHCFPQLFWIIQGDQGGHKWQLSELEQSFLSSIGKPEADTPQIGALPYAEYDNRVREKLLGADKLRRWRHRMDWEARYDRGVTEAGIIVGSERAAQRQAYATQTLAWLDSQIVDAVEDIPRRVLGKILDALPSSDDSPDADAEQMHQNLIEGAYHA